MNVLKRVTALYGATPLFVVFSALFAISELTVMWMVVPTAVSSGYTQQNELMGSNFNEDGLFAASEEVSSMIIEAFLASNKLDNDPERWQQSLAVKNPCHREIHQSTEITIDEKPSETWMSQQFLIEIADRAMYDLELTSIMKGRQSLANISGRIYQIGDVLLLSNASGSFVVISIGVDSVVLSLVITGDEVLEEFGPIERTIYIEGSAGQKFVDAGDGK